MIVTTVRWNSNRLHSCSSRPFTKHTKKIDATDAQIYFIEAPVFRCSAG